MTPLARPEAPPSAGLAASCSQARGRRRLSRVGGGAGVARGGRRRPSRRQRAAPLQPLAAKGRVDGRPAGARPRRHATAHGRGPTAGARTPPAKGGAAWRFGFPDGAALDAPRSAARGAGRGSGASDAAGGERRRRIRITSRQIASRRGSDARTREHPGVRSPASACGPRAAAERVARDLPAARRRSASESRASATRSAAAHATDARRTTSRRAAPGQRVRAT